VLAAHGDQHEQRKAAFAHHAEHVDAVADAARLHEQRAARAAQPRAGGKPDALLLGAEHDRLERAVGEAQLDQALVAGVGHVADLPDLRLLERAENLEGPVDHRDSRGIL